MAQSGPSFDCAKAGVPAEFAICASSALAALDRQLAAAYSSRRAEMGAEARDVLSTQQRGWLVHRNTCGAEESCLAAAMQQRIAALSEAPAAGEDKAGTWQPISTSVMMYGAMTLSNGELQFPTAAYSISQVRPGSHVFRVDGRRGDEMLRCGPDAVTHVALVPHQGQIALVEYVAAVAPPEPDVADLVASTSGTGRCAIGWFED